MNPEPRVIARINYTGLHTLVEREIGRFLNVYTQTVVAPVVTTLMFYTIFALAFGGAGRSVGAIPYMEFLAPGLIMMTMAQNAFANSSSSVVISKIQGNIVDVLMPPLSSFEIFAGYITASMVRGLIVGTAAVIVLSAFAPIHIRAPGTLVIYAVLGVYMMGALGLAAGIWSEKFDHIAAVTNFAVTPLTFLSGTFYSIGQLPDIWQKIAACNPFFYMIDGFRAGFLEQSDAHIFTGIGALCAANGFLTLLVLIMLERGYKIKS